MNKFFKSFLVLMLFSSTGIATASCKDTCDVDCAPFCGTGNAYFSLRSQSVNAARDLVGWQGHINKFDMEERYGAFYILPEYTRTFKPSRIAGYLFGQDYKDGQLTISGSRKGVTSVTHGAADAAATFAGTAVARGENEWLADYFGLSPDYEGTVKFEPRIQNFLVDFGLYIGSCKERWEGGFLKIHTPLVHTRWTLNPCEDVTNRGVLGFDMGYMNSKAEDIPATELQKSWLDAMAGDSTWGDMQEKMKYGLIGHNCCTLKRTRLSDIEVALGWNFLQDEDYHFGLMLRASAPTGNKPEATYLFEPIVGSGGHWMLGGGLTTHLVVWTDDQEEATFSAYLDANFGHYFNAKQMRSFDLKNKPNSRYMLIEEMDESVSKLYSLTDWPDQLPSAQYQKALFPLINKTTCCTDVSIAVQGDVAIKLAWAKNEWSFDIGYNVWGRTGEKFKNDCCTKTCCLKDENKWALKGDSWVTGFEASDSAGTPGQIVALSASQSEATINGGRNTTTGTAFAVDQMLNYGVDNADLVLASGTVNDSFLVYREGKEGVTSATVKTSKEPKFLACDDLDTCDTPKAISHKMFLNLNYDWMSEEKDGWNTFMGLGGEVEFAGKTEGEYASVSQWGVWAKCGVTFD